MEDTLLGEQGYRSSPAEREAFGRRVASHSNVSDAPSLPDEYYAEIEATMPEFEACSLQDPVLRPFCSMLRWLCLTGDWWGQSKTYLWAHRGVVFVLVCWAFFGWTIRLSYLLARQDMPYIPGWMEVSASLNDSLVSAYLLCFVSIFSYLYMLWYFAYHRDQIKLLCTEVFLVCDVAQRDALAQVSKAARLCAMWSMGSGVVGVFVTIGVSRASKHDYVTVEPPAAVAFDMAVTLLAFTAQFSVTAFAAAYLYTVCSFHVTQIEHFKNWLERETRSKSAFAAQLAPKLLPLEACDGTPESCDPASKAAAAPLTSGTKLTMLGVFERHQRVLYLVGKTSKTWQHYVTYVSVAMGLAIIVTILNVFFRETFELQVALAFRVGFLIIMATPICVAVWKAASVSTMLAELSLTVNNIPPNPQHPEQASFLRIYFSAVGDTGGFTLFGFVLTSKLFFRIVNATGVFVIAAVQFYFSRHHDS